MPCPLCGNNIILKNDYQFSDNTYYYWICSNIPRCPFYHKTLVKKIDIEEINPYFRERSVLSAVRAADPIDGERHVALDSKYPWRTEGYVIPKELDGFSLDFGFETKREMIFWFMVQSKLMNPGIHNYLHVGSPYYFVFTDIYQQIIGLDPEMSSQLKMAFELKMKSLLKSWEAYQDSIVKEIDKSAALRAEEERKNKIFHQKKIADDATYKIYDAIRRKDIKAVIALRKKGARLNEINRFDKSAIEYAKEIGNQTIIELLNMNNNEFLSREK